MTRKRLRGPLEAVICDVCGRENADNLTFCLDCGRRLRPQGRGVPPTPPHGMERIERVQIAEPPRERVDAEPASAPAIASNPAPSASPTSASPTSASPISALPSSSAKPSAPRSRPEAPALQFTVSFGAESITTCSSCRSSNPPGYRFCVTCGAALGRPAAVAVAVAATPEGAPATIPDDTGEKIIGAPVVGIATPRTGPPKLVRCARCQGHSAEGMRFCKYCGAPLDEGEKAPRAEAEPVLVDPGASSGAGRKDDRSERVAPAFVSPGPVAPTVSTAVSVGARPRTGRLVVIVEDGSEGKAFPLQDRQVDVGRAEGDILLTDDLYVSPRHARLLPQGGHWIVRDLHSTNGVYRRIREPHALKDGDLLLLGLEVLQFETVNDAERGLGHATQHGTLLFGSPSMPRRARLCQRTVEGVTRDVYHLFRDETVIGREVGDIVFTADPFLSRRHAVLRRSAASGEFSIMDLDSSNGTYVAIRSDFTLGNGDYLRIGQHLFRVDLS